jgi:hypothetical protein
MQRSSKIALGVCFVLLVGLVTLFVQYRMESQPDLSEQDARLMLDRLAEAFARGSTERVLSFAAPDAKVAGRDLEEIRSLLQRGFRYMKNPELTYKNFQYVRRGETVHLRFDVHVKQSPDGQAANAESIYLARIGFTVRRIEIPRMLGLMRTYEWKISDVDAPNMPASWFQ